MRTQKHPKIQSSAPGFLPAVTAALAAAGLLTSAHAQLQTAAPLLISVDATAMAAGPATGIPNTGTLGGYFEAIGGGGNAPMVRPVNGNGTLAIRFDGDDFLQHVSAIGGALIPADAGLVGVNPSCTIEAWVLNPSISQEETVVAWGHRNGSPDGSNMSFNYGWDDRWGSVGHWGGTDLGWDPCCDSGSNPPGVPVPGVWHHLVYTYDGTTQKVYSDGVLKNQENVGLNIHAGPPVTIAAQIEGDGVTVTGGLRGTMAIARLRVHDGALTDGQVASNYNFEKADFSNGGSPLASGPTHRYRFNNPAGPAANGVQVNDIVGTAHANVRGAGATFTGKRLTLPGGSSATQAYVDLPNGLLSANSANNGGSGGVTLEGWVKVTGGQTWARFFDIGSTIIANGTYGEVTGPGGAGEGRDYWALFEQENANVYRHVLDLRNEDPAGGAGTGGVGYDSHSFGSDLHFVATWNEASGEMKIYENGSEVTGRTGAPQISDIHDVNVWLGRSNWGGDANMQGDFDDFRIYNRVLAAAEIRGSYIGGADILIPVNVLGQPQNITVALPAPATFSVVVEGETPLAIQWYRDDVAIPGANALSYTVSNTSLADSGSKFHAVISNTVGGTPHTATSTKAELTVILDNFPPTLVSARAPSGNPTQFDLVFSESVNAAEAGNIANYTASGFTISSVAVQNPTTVRFNVSSLYTVGCKTLTVSGIHDQASTPNLIAANSQIGVVSAAGAIRYEQFNDIGGVTPNDLFINAKFPNAPDVVQNVTQFENPAGSAGQGDNYGAHLVGFLSPPVSGAYRFLLSADDGAILYLSTDESPAHKVAIAAEPIWSAFRAYNGSGAGGGGRACPGPACNQSEPIVLQAGCKYFVEFFYKEGGGGDFGSVTWQLPGAPTPADGAAPIPGAFLSPFQIAPTIGTDVADQTILDGRKVTLTSDIFGTVPLTYQWYRDGVLIDGATGPSYTTDYLRLATDNGATFYVVVQNGLGTTQSRTATITILADNTPPTIVSALGGAGFDTITLQFSEPVNDLQAVDPFNFTVDGGVGVNSATLGAGGTSVTLSTSAQTENTIYTVTVSGVQDLAENFIENGTISFRSFVVGGGGVVFERYNGNSGGNVIQTLLNNPKFPNSPDVTSIVTSFNVGVGEGDNFGDNYGGRMRALFIPQVSGNYIFYISSDDASVLYINPNGPNAAGKVKVQEELGCCGNYTGHATAPLAMVAGQGYYMEALYQEGGGGDYCRVAVRLQGTAAPAARAAEDAIPGALLGYPAAPAGVAGEITITQQPASTSVAEQTTYTFTVAASNPNGLPQTYQWRRDGVDVVGATGPTYSALASLADNGAVFSVQISMIGNRVVSGDAVLSVVADVSLPTIVSASGGEFMERIIIRYSELMNVGNVTDTFNYAISGGVTVGGAALQADGTTVVLTLDPATPLAEDTDYTVTVSGVSDRAETPNFIAPDSTVTFHSLKFAPGLLNFAAFLNFPGASLGDMDNMINSPKYPDRPDDRKFVPRFDSTSAGAPYNNNSVENYGARLSGVFVPPTSGNWIFYLRSDDASRLYLNPTGLNPGGKVLLTEEAGCCGAFDGHPSAPQALTAGTRYFIESIYKEGGGGDYVQVAAKLETDPTPPNSLQPISGANLGAFVNGVGANVAITDQPDDVLYVIDPNNPTGGATSLAAQTFTGTDGGYTVVNSSPAADGPWSYSAASGTWSCFDRAACAVPNASTLVSAPMTITKSGRVALSFSHRFSFEYDGTRWDGGQVRVRVNGGAAVMVPGTSFSENGYSGIITGNNALTGTLGFNGDSAGYGAGSFITSSASLGAFSAGDVVQLEFVAAWDECSEGSRPNWEITTVNVTEGAQDPVFRVSATGAFQGAPFTPLYQWQRNNGAGWVDVLNAVGSSLILSPTLADNGARFRVIATVPTVSVTSSEATLTVIQINTAPRFTAGANQTAAEDSGAQVVPGWATDIFVHSILRVPITYASDFSAVPAGSRFFGDLTPVVQDGVLKLTDAGDPGGLGGFAVGFATRNFESVEASWKSRVGGGGGGGADGYSFNVGTDLSDSFTGEEGTGTGLSVTVDTFDNGTGEDVGVDLKWRGARVGYAPIPKDDDGTGVYLRKDTFVNVTLEVSPGGLATLNYDGTIISAQLSAYTGVNANQFNFGARTGGANDNQWIDDLDVKGFPFDASSVESAQTVQFLVSGDNPSLFSVQPAISPDGTLTYTPAANAFGSATLTVVARDNGGTTAGGHDTSLPSTFTITITPINDCPVVASQVATTAEDTALALSSVAFDVDNDPLTYTYSTPSHGAISGTAPNLLYTPNANYSGPDSFVLTVSDGQCSGSGTVTIQVTPVNDTPIAKITGSPLVEISPTENKVLISCNGSNAVLLLDASLSSDVETPASALAYLWFVEPSPLSFATGITTSIPLEIGTHTILLSVTDDNIPVAATGMDSLTIDVITSGEAIEELITSINESTVSRSNKRPFIATLKAAAASAERGQAHTTANQLNAFQNKVLAQVATENPVEAAAWIRASQAIVDALNRCE
jgi:hypothetical protein